MPKSKRVMPRMSGRGRAERLPKGLKEKYLDWDTYVCPEGHVHLNLTVPGLKRPVCLSLAPEDGYELMADLGRAYDQANGI
jgi:hypothetical protein